MPISMFERSAKGTSLVTSSQSNTAKLHMSAERRLISSGFFCRAERTKDKWCIKGKSWFKQAKCIVFCFGKQKKLGKRANESKMYLQVPPMLESTSCRDTGKRTSHPPCLSWLSCHHQSVSWKKKTVVSNTVILKVFLLSNNTKVSRD